MGAHCWFCHEAAHISRAVIDSEMEAMVREKVRIAVYEAQSSVLGDFDQLM